MSPPATRILADSGIVGLDRYIHPADILRLYDGHPDAKALENCDILLVRTGIHITQDLIEKTEITAIGSATAGTDHIDSGLIGRRGPIETFSAPGANARAVAEYVASAITAAGFHSNQATPVRVQGYGPAGRHVAALLDRLGFRVSVEDPLLDPAAIPQRFRTHLGSEGIRILTLHMNLHDGAHSTVGWWNDSRRAEFPDLELLINSARAPMIVDGLTERRNYRFIRDVWQGEPDRAPGPDADLTTPHIAGWSRQAKERMTILLLRAMAGLPPVDTCRIRSEARLEQFHSVAVQPLSRRLLAAEDANRSDIFRELRAEAIQREESDLWVPLAEEELTVPSDWAQRFGKDK